LLKTKKNLTLKRLRKTESLKHSKNSENYFKERTERSDTSAKLRKTGKTTEEKYLKTYLLKRLLRKLKIPKAKTKTWTTLTVNSK